MHATHAKHSRHATSGHVHAATTSDSRTGLDRPIVLEGVLVVDCQAPTVEQESAGRSLAEATGNSTDRRHNGNAQLTHDSVGCAGRGRGQGARGKSEALAEAARLREVCARSAHTSGGLVCTGLPALLRGVSTGWRVPSPGYC